MATPNVAALNPSTRLVGPSCWNGEAMARHPWYRQLSAEELDALEQMVDKVRPQVGDDPNALLSMRPADFSVGAFARVLQEVDFDLRHGKGFSVIGTLPVHRWTPVETLIAYWGIGCQLGDPLASNAAGDMIGHVVDLGRDYGQANIRGYDTNVKLSYHVDQCDVVGLLCLRPAREGGESKLVSSAAVHNEILRRRPDLLAALKAPLFFSWMGEEAPGQERFYKAPVFDFVDGHFHCAAGVNHIRKGHALPGAPVLTEAQTEALQMFEAVCEELEFSMRFAPGDIQFLNNGLVAHTRTDFTDWPERARRRHLLRIWLQVPTLHRGAAYFENWRDGVTPRDNHRTIRLSPFEGC